MKTPKLASLSVFALLALGMALLPAGAVKALLVDAGFWTPASDLGFARDYYTATLLNDGTVLVAGGKYGNSSAELFDPAGETWLPTGNLHKGREAHTATLLNNGAVLVTGGLSLYGQYLASAELYDPILGGWLAVSPMNTRRYLHTATRLANGKVLVAGGANSEGYLYSAEIFDPLTKTWQATGWLRTARYLHTATLLDNGKVLVVGGKDSSGNPAGAELYDPATGKWTVIDALHNGRARHTATLLPNGKVLVTGGVDTNDMALASAELYDPATGRWALTGALNAARANHTATLLSSGWVLVAGGSDDSFNIFASAEIYDPLNGVWVATGEMGNSRFAHTATKLTDGKVLVAGGFDGTQFLSSAELYTPVKFNQSINVVTSAPTTAVYGATFTVAASATSGLPVSYSADGICTNMGATFTMTKSIGTCTVKYNQAGDGLYNAAPQVTQTVKGIPTEKTFVSNKTQDGWVLESAEKSAKGGSVNAIATTFRLGDDAANKQYRSILSFKTDSLPDNAKITKVILKIGQYPPTGANLIPAFQGLIVDLKRGIFGASVALEKTDFEAAASKSLVPVKPVPVSGLYTLNLGSAALPYINKLSAYQGGYTQLRLRFNLDDNNNNVANLMSFFSAEAASRKPQLIITYSVP